MTTTDDARLLEIEAREQAATPGPWRAGIDVARWSDYDVETKAYCWETERPAHERPDGFGACEDVDDCEGHDLDLAPLCDVRGPEHLNPTEDSGFFLHEKDAQFIAHAREDVRYLLDRIASIKARERGAIAFWMEAEGYQRARADAAESRIRELEDALRLMRSSDLVLNDTHDPYTCEQPSCVLARRLLDEVQDAR